MSNSSPAFRISTMDDGSPNPKYYKMRLDPHYQKGMISEKTRKLWEDGSKTTLEQIIGTGKNKL